jgi:hypothetical protein
MANTTTSPASSERSHTLKAYLHKLHLPIPLRTASTTSTSSASVTDTTTPTTSTPYPTTLTRPKGDDSILEHRTKLKLTGDAKPGSHSAYWGLTPDGQKHEPTYVDASEISRVVEFEDGTETKKGKGEKAVKQEE